MPNIVPAYLIYVREIRRSPEIFVKVKIISILKNLAYSNAHATTRINVIFIWSVVVSNRIMCVHDKK